MSAQRVAVVTGGASGIGAATTRRLLKDGWRVAVWSRNSVSNDEVRKSLVGDDVVICECDVASESAIQTALARTVDELGLPTGLVCCAGSAGRVEPLARRKNLTDWRSQLSTAIDAVVVPIWQLVSAWRSERQPGAVVVVGSLAAVNGQPLNEAYAASKGAGLALVRSLASQLGRHGVRVNAVLPGWIDTPMIESMLRLPSASDRLTQRVALGRLGAAEEVASAIAFLLDDDSSYVTGHALVVDGGYSVM